MSASKLYASNSLDPEQRDLAISQIRTEILEIKQREQKFDEEYEQLQKLDHLFFLLKEDKVKSETDNKGKLDYTLHSIANLKTDLDALKHTVSQGSIESQKLKAENASLKEIADHKTLNLADLKNEQSAALDINGRLRDDIRYLESQLNVAKDDKRNLLAQLDRLDILCRDLRTTIAGQDKTLQDLEFEKSRKERQILATQTTIDGLNADLKAKTQDLANLDDQIVNTNRKIQILDADARDLEKLNEKTRQEALEQQKAHQEEITKNVDWNAKIATQDNTLKARDGNVADLKSELEVLKRAYAGAQDNHAHLNNELDHVNEQIQTMEHQNNELVKELEGFSHQDQKVLQILDRGDKVDELKNKSATKMNSSLNTIERVKSSPIRKNRNASPSPTKF